MTSLPASETSRVPQPDRAPTHHRKEQQPQGEAAPLRGGTTDAPRESPDPFVATDRYRLNMPFADRL